MNLSPYCVEFKKNSLIASRALACPIHIRYCAGDQNVVKKPTYCIKKPSKHRGMLHKEFPRRQRSKTGHVHGRVLYDPEAEPARWTLCERARCRYWWPQHELWKVLSLEVTG